MPKKVDKTMLYETNRHSCFLLEYHLVVVTKYRHPVLVGAVRERLLEITKTLFEENYDCHIISMETDKDHIHILFSSKPQIQPSKIANSYKTVTSRYLRKEFADDLKQYYWKPYFWSDSYFIGTVGVTTHDVVKNYIENQGK